MSSRRTAASRRLRLLLAVALVGCDPDGTVNDGNVAIQSTVRAASSPEGDGLSRAATLSGDGSRVLFHTVSTNFDPADGDTEDHAYLSRLQGGNVELVSRQAGTGGAKNFRCAASQISADGRFAALMVLGLPGLGAFDLGVVVRDLDAHTVEVVSRAPGASGAIMDLGAGNPTISADGSLVAFDSEDFGVVPGDGTSGDWDVYLRDRTTHDTSLVSVSSAGVKGDADSRFPSLSADGTRVAFQTLATNLGGTPVNGVWNVYVRTLSGPGAGTTTLASIGPPSRFNGSTAIFADSVSPRLSGDGRRVVFLSEGADLHNLEPGVFIVHALVRDLDTNETFIADRVDGPGGIWGNNHCSSAAISHDGRFVAFTSKATNLVPGDQNGFEDAFVRDLQEQRTWRVSVRTFGAEANGPSTDAAISGDGRYAAFASSANNLVDGDFNGVADIFVRGPLR